MEHGLGGGEVARAAPLRGRPSIRPFIHPSTRAPLGCIVAALLALLAAGCRAPTDARRGEPVFVVETWGGARHVGRLALGADVGPGALPVEAVRLIAQRPAAAEPGPLIHDPGFETLTAVELARYRERAVAAAKRHPGSPSILCLDHDQDVLTPDGRHLHRNHSLTLVLKDEARDVADLELEFDEGRSRQRVLFARSIAPDGREQWLDPLELKVAVPPEHELDVDPRLRVLSGRVPGVAVGSLVEIAREEEVYNPDVPDYFFPEFLFQASEPTLDAVFEVGMPAGRKLNWTTRRMPEAAREPQRAARRGLDLYRWELRDLSPIESEPAMPDTYDISPRVACSPFFDWGDLFGRTARYYRERIETTPEVAALAKTIVGEAATDDARLAAIYHWVQQTINYLSVKSSLSSDWAGHPASETLKNGYGDCTDKAILLASLARAVGIQAYPVSLLTNDCGTATTDIPTPDANHCIDLVLPGGQPRFLDCTSRYHRYPAFRADDHGVKAIVEMTGQILDIPVPPPAANLRESRQHIALAPDGSATVVERNAYAGETEADIRYAWEDVPPAERRETMQEFLQGRCAGALCTALTLSDIEALDQPMTMEIRYSVPHLATRRRDLYLVALPGFAREFPEAGLPTRQHPIERLTTEERRTTVEVAAPPGHAPVGLPQPIAIHGKHLWYEGRVEAAADGRTITVRETLKYLTRRVPPEDYAAYRRHATAIAAWTRFQLVFRASERTAEPASHPSMRSASR
jgi:transglutaminase-like putative cysteine protease